MTWPTIGRVSAPHGRESPRSRSREWALGWALLGVGLLSGCASYNQQIAALDAQWTRGDMAQAARSVGSLVEHHGEGKDGTLLLLEKGAVLRGAGDLAASNEVFERAYASIQKTDEDPRLSLSSEFVANLSNLAQLPYQARFYDRVMLHTYAALNAIALADDEAARVHLNRALEAQRDALNENQRRLEQAQEEARKRDEASLPADRILEDPSVQGELNQRFAHLSERAAYAPYVNPFAVYLDGLYFLYRGVDASDRERGRVSLLRMRELIGVHPAVEADIELAESGVSVDSLEPITYVIFETGRAPRRRQIIFDFPSIIFSTTVPYVGVALPDLDFRGDYRSYLEVMDSDDWVQTRTIADLDSVVAQEFQDRLPLTVTRSLSVTGSRIVAQYLIQEGLRDQQTLRTLAAIGGYIYQASVNQADLRTWSTLPKQLQAVRIPTPPGRLLEVRDPTSGKSEKIELKPSRVQVVFIKSTSTAAPLHTSIFTLR